jgi:hypothetical protein
MSTPEIVCGLLSYSLPPFYREGGYGSDDGGFRRCSNILAASLGGALQPVTSGVTP